MPENTLIESREWLVAVAWRVRELVRHPAVMERFREMLLGYCMSWRWKRSTRSILERRFRDHQDRIILDPRLRDEEAGPPAPGWDWRYTLLYLHHPEQTIEVEGWVPPDLLIELRPELETALPLCDRPRTLEEKYAIMAAIHDHSCRGVEKIRPWSDQVQDDSVKAYVEPTLYREIVSDVAGLTVRDQPSVKTCLADVEDDLAKPTVDLRLGKPTEEPSARQSLIPVPGKTERREGTRTGEQQQPPDRHSPQVTEESVAGEPQSAELPWDEKREGFVTGKEGVKLSDDKLSLAGLSRLCRPSGSMRYMRKKGVGLRVRLVDLRQYLESTHPQDGFDQIDEYVADVEERKAQARKTKEAGNC